MNERDLDILAKGLAPVVKQMVADAVAPFQRRIEELEGRAGPAHVVGSRVDAGILIFSLSNGEQLTVGDVTGPAGRDGRDGTDGKDGTDADQSAALAHIDTQITKAIAALPAPSRGEDGAPGQDGKDGRSGADGRDGAGTAGAVIDRDGNLILTLSDGKTIDLGRVVGRDGKSVDPEEVDRLIAQKIAALPAPKDGRDGSDVDMTAVRELVSVEIREAVAALPEPKDPTIFDMDDVRERISTEVREAVATIPVPKDGKDGVDGRNVDIAEVRELVGAEVRDAVSALPAPKDGIDVDMDVVAERITAELREAVSAIPVPRDGKDGRDGVDGKDADMTVLRTALGEMVAALPKPERGEKGEPGQDGVGFSEALIDREGRLVLTQTDGKTLPLGIVIGRDGADGVGEPGRDGIDGLGFDDLRVEQINEREAKLIFTRGDRVKEFTLAVPGLVYRGVWTDGEYEPGDAVTLGGSLFIAQEATTEKPEESKAWRLAVKRGKDGARGDRGKDGKDGRDGKDWRPPGLDGVQG